MTDDGTITNQMLLEHMHAQKYELLQEMKAGFTTVDHRFRQINERFERLEKKVDEGFTELQRDTRGLREDLDATILMQAKHEEQLAVLTGGPLPETCDY